jgi:hypothetical protein
MSYFKKKTIYVSERTLGQFSDTKISSADKAAKVVRKSLFKKNFLG